MSEWISVKERLPESRHDVLAYDGSFVVSAQIWRNYRGPQWSLPSSVGGCEAEANFNENGITHWMPLPPPPKGDK